MSRRVAACQSFRYVCDMDDGDKMVLFGSERSANPSLPCRPTPVRRGRHLSLKVLPVRGPKALVSTTSAAHTAVPAVCRLYRGLLRSIVHGVAAGNSRQDQE